MSFRSWFIGWEIHFIFVPLYWKGAVRRRLEGFFLNILCKNILILHQIFTKTINYIQKKKVVNFFDIFLSWPEATFQTKLIFFVIFLIFFEKIYV